MKYSDFVRFSTELYSQKFSSMFLSGFTIQGLKKSDAWIVKTKILVANRAESEKLLQVVPIVEKLRMEHARASLSYEDGAIILSAEIPATSRFLAARHAMENYLLLARFWQEELSPLTLLTM